MGEVGLDYCRVTNLGHQRGRFVGWLPRPPHWCSICGGGATSDPLGREPMVDCQSLLTQHRTPALVPLYLHSFTGGPSQVDEWIATGRVVFFGVSGLLCFFTHEQILGIRRIPAYRLLLETDSPHLRVGPQKMTPGQIGLIYRRVAEIRQIDISQLAAQVRANFARLFGHQLRTAPLPGGN